MKVDVEKNQLNIDPLESFMRNLERWIMNQDEWPLIFLAPRNTRRQLGRVIGKRVSTLPHVTHRKQASNGPIHEPEVSSNGGSVSNAGS